MTSRLDRRTALIAAGSALLLLALAFLFVRTQATGYKDQVQALALLRELRDAVHRWDADGLRLANDRGSAQGSVPDRGPIVARIFHELDQAGGRAGLGDQVAQMRSGMTEKEAAFKALRAAHGRFIESLSGAREAPGAPPRGRRPRPQPP